MGRLRQKRGARRFASRLYHALPRVERELLRGRAAVPHEAEVTPARPDARALEGRLRRHMDIAPWQQIDKQV